jgi:hypothetical protein
MGGREAGPVIDILKNWGGKISVQENSHVITQLNLQ